MQDASPYATKSRVGCVMWLAIIALIISLFGIVLDITQEMAWNGRMEELAALETRLSQSGIVAVQPLDDIRAESPTPQAVTITSPDTTSVETDLVNTPAPVDVLASVPTLAVQLLAPQSPTVPPAATPSFLTGYSAPDIIHEFRMAGLPIGEVVEYTAETDPNSLLGRPNQYIQKISWKDTRIVEVGEPGTSTGGTVEVFLNVENMEARKAYVSTVSQTASFLVQYSFSNGTILVRLSHDLTPDQAAEYENVLMNLSSR